MAATQKQIKNLKPIQKGEVRNPNGRPVGSQNTKTILGKILNTKIKKDNPLTDKVEDMTVLELMNYVLVANATQGDLSSYKEVIDRFEGKVLQENKSNVNITEIIKQPIFGLKSLNE
jgi:hypothetical protein